MISHLNELISFFGRMKMASSPLESHQWLHLQQEQERIWRPCLAKERNTIHARPYRIKRRDQPDKKYGSISQETVVGVLVQQLKTPSGNLVHWNGTESAILRQVDETQVVRLVDIRCIKLLASICQCSSDQCPKALADVLVTAEHEHSAIHHVVCNPQAGMDLIPHMQHLNKLLSLPATKTPWKQTKPPWKLCQVCCFGTWVTWRPLSTWHRTEQELV